jgi:TolB protein
LTWPRGLRNTGAHERGYFARLRTQIRAPSNHVADIAHSRGALVGYVHPFDEYPEPISRPKEILTTELPVDVALGKVDYMEILGFNDHRSTARVWYQLLNLGFRIPAAGGTDAMGNFASLRGPVGMNRVYVRVPDGEVKPEQWMANLKDGRSFATMARCSDSPWAAQRSAIA